MSDPSNPTESSHLPSSRDLMSRPLPAVLATILGLALGCTGNLVASQAFNSSGDVDWSTTVPVGKGSLWLNYTIDAPAGTSLDGPDPHYNFVGTMTVSTAGKVFYQGPLTLSPSDSPVAGSGSSTRVGTSTTCVGPRCKASGRTKLLNLSELSAGDSLGIQAHLPLEADDATASMLSLQVYQR